MLNVLVHPTLSCTRSHQRDPQKTLEILLVFYDLGLHSIKWFERWHTDAVLQPDRNITFTLFYYLTADEFNRLVNKITKSRIRFIFLLVVDEEKGPLMGGGCLSLKAPKHNCIGFSIPISSSSLFLDVLSSLSSII